MPRRSLHADPFRCLDDPEPPKTPPPAPAPAPHAEGFELDGPPIMRDPDLLRHAPVRSRLRVNGEFLVHFRRYRPGPWRRFWTWALLGWTWEKAE